MKFVTTNETPEVVLLIHAGIPEAKLSICPFVPAGNLANVFVADE